MIRFLFLSLLAGAIGVCAQPDPERGLYAIWAQDPKLAHLPFIRGGQVVVQWKTVEPAEGKYDFSSIDEQLEVLHREHRAGTVQVNGNEHPAYLFEKAPYIRKKLSIQVRDDAGTLAYWHPNYIQAYRNLLAAYGKHLKQSKYRENVLGVRLNFNALGTEHMTVEAEDNDPAAWVVPKGIAPAPRWDRAKSVQYRDLAVGDFVLDFRPEVRVFARNNMFGGGDVNPEWINLLETGRLGLFHTSSEMEPRQGNSGQYEAFRKYCRSGKTVCYAEPWADAWGRHGGKTDPRWCGPEQFNYWRLLVDLDCGVSFIALYGADLAHADNPEFRAAFEFAARYAGYHASPTASPGAWIALREGNTLKGDYSFLMRRLPGDPMDAVEKAGPAGQRFGAWARTLKPGAKARFALDEAFAGSLRKAVVRVTYLDRGTGTLNVEFGGQRFATALKGTNRWQTAEYAAAKPGEAIALTGSAELVLHMVEVTR